VLEFQVEEAVAPRIAHILRRAEIPLIAIDVPHPNSTYFGVDNFEAGYEAGALLAEHAQVKWKGKADRAIGVGFKEAGSFVQSRITGAFDGIRERLPELTGDRLLQIEGRGMREASRKAMEGVLRGHRAGERVAGGHGHRFERPGGSGCRARAGLRAGLCHRRSGLHSRGA